MLFSTIIPSITQRLTWMPTRLIFAFFYSLEIRGLDNLEKSGTNFIIASSHSSETDPIIIVACLPFFSHHLPIFFVSREKEFYNDMGWKKNIYGGTLFKMWGAFQAYVGLNNYKLALRDHLELLRNGENILIFPSGTRNAQEYLPKAKGGVSFLAQETQLPIVPALIQGTEHITLGDFWARNKKIRVTFGEPLYAKDIFKNIESMPVNDERNGYEIAASILMEKIERLRSAQVESKQIH